MPPNDDPPNPPNPENLRAPTDNVVDFPSPDETVERLAKLSKFEYEQERPDAADRLKDEAHSSR